MGAVVLVTLIQKWSEKMNKVVVRKSKSSQKKTTEAKLRAARAEIQELTEERWRIRTDLELITNLKENREKLCEALRDQLHQSAEREKDLFQNSLAANARNDVLQESIFILACALRDSVCGASAAPLQRAAQLIEESKASKEAIAQAFNTFALAVLNDSNKLFLKQL